MALFEHQRQAESAPAVEHGAARVGCEPPSAARSAEPENTTRDAIRARIDTGAGSHRSSALVAQAIRRLPAEHRRTLVETYYRDASVSEAATRLGIAPSTVKAHLHYALHALRLRLTETGALPPATEVAV